MAALSVLVFHAFVIFDTQTAASTHALWHFTAHYGYLGVDLFFVLSGFLLARPFLSDPSRLLARSTWTSFVGRRLLRTAPAYYAAILLALAISGNWAFFVTQPSAMLLHFAYLPTSDPATLALVNIAFWSLAVEFQFYLIMPFFLAALLRRPWTILASTGILAFAWPFLMLTFTGAEGGWVAVQIPGYLFHFALGMGAAMLEHNGWRPNVRSVILAPAALLFLVIAPNLLAVPPAGTWNALDEPLGFAIWRSIPAIGFAVLVFLSVHAAGVTKRILESAPALHMGKISFSLYLTHFPVMLALPKVAPWTTSFGTTGFVLATFLASWPIAALFYALIEAPSLAWKSRLTTPTAAARVPAPAYQVDPRPILPDWPATPAKPAEQTR